jgi:aspartate-semialdehyde dehydrogenase
VVGATGVVGATMLQVLAEREFPADEIVLFASARSRGAEIDGRPVHVLDDDADLSGIDIALFSAGAGTSRAWAHRFVEADRVDLPVGVGDRQTGARRTRCSGAGVACG